MPPAEHLTTPRRAGRSRHLSSPATTRAALPFLLAWAACQAPNARTASRPACSYPFKPGALPAKPTRNPRPPPSPRGTRNDPVPGCWLFGCLSPAVWPSPERLFLLRRSIPDRPAVCLPRKKPPPRKWCLLFP